MSSGSASDSPFVKRVNVVGWLFVVFVALLVEVGVRAFDYEESIATPSSTLRAPTTGSRTARCRARSASRSTRISKGSRLRS